MAEPHVHDVIVIGAGVAGICQIKHLVDRGFDALVLEANAGVGGTWYNNRYPGCRFDSESYTYGYAFSPELLEEWHWKELFSAQPENLRYLEHVVERFGLAKHIRCNAPVAGMAWDEEARRWAVHLEGGATLHARFVVTAVGVLSVPTLPDLPGMDSFRGEAFHTFHWPQDGIDLSGRRVGVVGTGATGIQVIAEIADKVGELTVFQRHPNWSVPLNNRPLTDADMADIRARYAEIFRICDASNGGFDHLPDRRGYANVSTEERHRLWHDLYHHRGFALLLANFPETFLEEDANRALSDWVADRIRERVSDPAVAEKLIPRDHGFGMRRLPLETNYFEAYNRANVHLVDLTEAPIERVTADGIQTSAGHHDLDVLVLATGFDAITGALKRLDIRGAGGEALADRWHDATRTYLGILSHGFPNMLMVAGPQSVSGSTNYPRAIEVGVGWVTDLLEHARANGHTRLEVQEAAEQAWTDEVVTLQERMPFSRVKSWFTGYSPNAEGGGIERRYNAYWGGAPRYREALAAAADGDYPDIDKA